MCRSIRLTGSRCFTLLWGRNNGRNGLSKPFLMPLNLLSRNVFVGISAPLVKSYAERLDPGGEVGSRPQA
jgi:hypothetical protein